MEMASLVLTILQAEGFQVVHFCSAEEADQAPEFDKIDLLLLDINLPGCDGYEFLTKIRKVYQFPVIFLTARQNATDIVSGLSSGADDYISKPFSSDVLVARIRAVLRRSSGERLSELRVVHFGMFEFEKDTQELRKADNIISLSSRESRLLLFLINHINTFSTPDEIYNSVWKQQYGDVTTVAVHINRLRNKIEDDPSKPVYIKTKPGSGYGLFSGKDGSPL
jgi:two-component system response regulator RegX3